MIQPLIKTLFGDSDAAANADTVKNFLFHKVVCTGSADAQNIIDGRVNDTGMNIRRSL